MAGAIFRDNFNNLKFVSAIDPASITGDTTGIEIDLQGYESCTFVLQYGTCGDVPDGSNYFKGIIHESSESGTGFAAAADADVIVNAGETAANAFGFMNSAADDNAIYALGYRGDKRYVKLIIDETGSLNTGTPVAAIAVLGHPRKAGSLNTTRLS